MFKIPINYYPFINQGHTIKLAGKNDPWRMYYNKPKYKIEVIGTYPDFKGIPIVYVGYILFEARGKFDYNVITSLN